MLSPYFWFSFFFFFEFSLHISNLATPKQLTLYKTLWKTCYRTTYRLKKIILRKVITIESMTRVLIWYLNTEDIINRTAHFYNDKRVIDSFEIKLHVLAFIPCRAAYIHGQRMVIVWPCTWCIRVGFITEYYIDVPKPILIVFYIFYCDFAFGLTCNVICNDKKNV